jgi:hypothetical protein
MQIGLTTLADVAPNHSAPQDSQLKPNCPQPPSGIHSIHSYQPGPLAQVFMEIIYPQAFMEIYIPTGVHGGIEDVDTPHACLPINTGE